MERKHGSGALFPNEKKETEKHPDMTGVLQWNDEEIQLAGWKTKSKAGKPYMSVKGSIRQKQEDNEFPF